MMDCYFFLFCFLSLLNIKIKGLDSFFSDYMELENTNSVKGIFVWLIIFCHKSSYIKNKNYLFFKIIGYLGQKVVSMFFFYSGFGIYESLKKKGLNYVKTLPKKAYILFLKFQIILFLYLTTNIFIFKNKVTIKTYLLSVIFKTSLGNSNWFAFTIILLYIYSYLSFIFINHHQLFGIVIMSFLCLFHCLLVYIYFYPGKIYSVDTVLCFVIGFYFSCIKNLFDKVIMINDICYFFITSFIIFAYYQFFISNYLIYISIRNALFSILVILISIKVRINNEFLKFLSSHSFSIYLLQRLIMWIVFRKNIFKNSDFIQTSFEFTSIFFISSLFDKYTSFIDNYFKRNLKRIERNKYIPLNNIYFPDIINKN